MAKPDAIQPIGTRNNAAICIYGHSGVGKTVLLSSPGERTLIIRPPTDHTVSVPPESRAEEWVVKTWNDMSEVHDYFRHEGGDAEYDWVWLDSISAFQDYGLDDIWDDVVAQNPRRKGTQLDRLEYWKNMSRLAEWVRHMVGMDTFNFGLTAWAFKEEDQDGNTILMPYVQGNNMSPKICGYMNGVFYLAKRTNKTTGETQRVLYPNEDKKFYAKDQFRTFDKPMVNPSMAKIIDKIGQAQRMADKKPSTQTAAARTRRTKTSRRT